MVKLAAQPSPALLPAETKAILTAVGYAEAAPIDGWSAQQHATLTQAGEKLAAASSRDMWLPFSAKDLELLWLALGNGAGDDAIHNLGLNAAERRRLGAAANRIKDAGRLGGPRF